MEKFSVSRLIGAPPGYVGYDQGGQLTEIVRRRPYSVILFDELEKAHPDIFNILLQILDEGRLTDGQGRTIDFKNTIIIMTSNIGSHLIQEAKKLEDVKNTILKEIRSFFKPEFINRIDDIILFHRLDKNDLIQIVKIQLKELAKRLLNKNIKIEYTDNLIKSLTDIGYVPQFGARPLKRAIQTYIENPLSKKIIANEIKEKDKIKIDIEKNKIKFSK
jgi:ATP-dependent Clp protease ATP-binding subunit ClpB